jgi:type I restriction enzyme, S subunit
VTEQDTQLHELPKGWIWTKIGEISLSIRDGTHTPPARVVQGIPLLSARNVKERYIDWEENFSFISSDDFDKIDSNNSIRENDILLTIVGTLGRACVVKTVKPFTIQRSVAIIRVDTQLLSPSFIQHVFNSPSFRKLLTDGAKGTAQQGIYLGTLGTLPLPLPPLTEQHRIVAKIEELFTRLDDGVNELKKVQLQLKRYRQSVLKSAFDGSLTVKWREEHKGELEPASMLLEKIKVERKRSGKCKELPTLDTKDLPELPKGWVWTRVGEIGAVTKLAGFEFTKYFKYQNVGDVKVVRGLNLGYGDFKPFDFKYITSEISDALPRSQLHGGELLIAYVGTLGTVAILPKDDQRYHLGPNVGKITISPNIKDARFLMYFFLSSIGQDIISSTSKAVTQSSLSMQEIRLMNIPLAPIKEQLKILEEIEKYLSVADEIEATIAQSLKQAERLRQSILKQAFEGKLVPLDPDDEPAEKLLERIKAEKMKININSKRGRTVNVR